MQGDRTVTRKSQPRFDIPCHQFWNYRALVWRNRWSTPCSGINTPDGEAIRGRSAEGSSYSWRAGGGEEGRKRWSLLFLQWPGDRRDWDDMGNWSQMDVNERRAQGEYGLFRA